MCCGERKEMVTDTDQNTRTDGFRTLTVINRIDLANSIGELRADDCRSAVEDAVKCSGDMITIVWHSTQVGSHARRPFDRVQQQILAAASRGKNLYFVICRWTHLGVRELARRRLIHRRAAATFRRKPGRLGSHQSRTTTQGSSEVVRFGTRVRELGTQSVGRTSYTNDERSD